MKIPLLPFRELFPISIWIEKRRRLFNPFAKLDFVSGVNFYVTAHFFRLQCKVLRYCSFILSREHRSTGLGGGFAEVTTFFQMVNISDYRNSMNISNSSEFRNIIIA